MISILQIALFIIGLLNQDPSRITELQQVQSQISQDLGQVSVTQNEPVETGVSGETLPVVTGVQQSPLNFTMSPTSIPSGATSTITIIANQDVFLNSEPLVIYGNSLSGDTELGVTNTYNISSDGTEASFDVYVPDGVANDVSVQYKGSLPKGTDFTLGTSVTVDNTVQPNN